MLLLALPARGAVLAKYAWYTNREDDYRQLESFLASGNAYGVYAMSREGKFMGTTATMSIVVLAPLACSHGFAFKFVNNPTTTHYTSYDDLLLERVTENLPQVPEELGAVSVCEEQD